MGVANSQDQPNTRDDAGLPIVYGTCKLLDMLGYGSIIDSENTGKAAITKKYLGVDNLNDAYNPLVFQTSQTVSALPFLAYQKIYYDFLSNPQWEKHKAYAYNVDYWTGAAQISLVTDMIQLRYANYPKDYFMGILPSSQYGSVASLPGANNSQNGGSFLVAAGGSAPHLVNSSATSAVLASAGPGSTTPVVLNSDLSARLS